MAARLQHLHGLGPTVIILVCLQSCALCIVLVYVCYSRVVAGVCVCPAAGGCSSVSSVSSASERTGGTLSASRLSTTVSTLYRHRTHTLSLSLTLDTLKVYRHATDVKGM